jgi:prephenate dehydratase-like protein
MPDPATWTVGTLGGPATFAGQATDVARGRYRELGTVTYYDTMDEVWDAVAAGEVACGILTAETTSSGVADIAPKLLDRDRRFHVAAEVVVPYHCMLLGKPGTSLEQIELVVGHGSLRQCRRFLAERLPGAEVRMHDLNSLAAAQEAMASDGSVAVVGTQRSADEHGLAVIAPDVDEGSQGAWWLLTRDLRISPRPDVVIVAFAAPDGETLSELTRRMRVFGQTPRSIAAINNGGLFRYDHLVVFSGEPIEVAVDDLVGSLEGCWPVGAFDARSHVLPSRGDSCA